MIVSVSVSVSNNFSYWYQHRYRWISFSSDRYRYMLWWAYRYRYRYRLNKNFHIGLSLELGNTFHTYKTGILKWSLIIFLDRSIEIYIDHGWVGDSTFFNREFIHKLMIYRVLHIFKLWEELLGVGLSVGLAVWGKFWQFFTLRFCD